MSGLLFSGEVLDVTEHERTSKAGNAYTDRCIHVLTGRKVERVRVAPRDYFEGQLPVKGDTVVLRVSVDTYLNRAGEAAYSLTAWAVFESRAAVDSSV